MSVVLLQFRFSIAMCACVCVGLSTRCSSIPALSQAPHTREDTDGLGASRTNRPPMMAHRHHRHHLLAMRVSYGGTALLAFYLLGYLLLEKKMLPRGWWGAASRFYFYPMMLPSLLARVMSGQPSFSDVDGGVMLGSVPMVLTGDVNALHRDGVRAVVNMQAEYEGPVAAYRSLHPPIVQLRIPVVDHVEPTIEQLEAAVTFIERHRAAGERVLIHCKGGHGRSAAVAMVWLMSERGGSLAPEAAQRRLSSVRHVRKALYKQPAVLDFYSRHGTANQRKASNEA